MRNKELFHELNELCKKYGFMKVKQNLKSLGLREFEIENYQTIGEKLSETINDIVDEKKEYRRWITHYTLNCDNEEYVFGVFDEENYKKSIRENQTKVLNVIMD